MDTINSHTKEAAAPIKTQWLPHYLHVHVSGNDSNSDSNSNDVTVTQSLADDLDQLETCDGGVTYELTALACLARRPAEEVSAYSLALVLLYFVLQPLSTQYLSMMTQVPNYQIPNYQIPNYHPITDQSPPPSPYRTTTIRPAGVKTRLALVNWPVTYCPFSR